MANWISFVGAKESQPTVSDFLKLQNEPTSKFDEQKATEMSGNEIREFYENLVSGSQLLSPDQQLSHVHIVSNPRKPQTRTPSSIAHSDSARLSVNEFLKAAAENNLEIFSRYISNSFDLNSTDRYGWTALMCAAQKGHMAAVRLLVTAGADIDRTDSSGRNAIEIALKSRQHHLANYLEEFKNYEPVNLNDKRDTEMDEDNQRPVFEPFFCQLCGMAFKETSPEDHQTSTLHQLNSSLPQPPTVYGLPESNVGFRLLRSSGWNAEKGLGAKEQGRKFPIATVLKRDRKGLGKSTEQPKVTHYPHMLEGKDSSKKQPATTARMWKDELMRNKKREMRLRRQLTGL